MFEDLIKKKRKIQKKKIQHLSPPVGKTYTPQPIPVIIKLHKGKIVFGDDDKKELKEIS